VGYSQWLTSSNFCGCSSSSNISLRNILPAVALSIGFNQDPKVGLGFDESRAFLVKLGTASKVAACEGDNVPCRTEALRTEQNGLWFEDTRTIAWPPSARDAAPATSACFLRMPGGRPFPWLL